jgi:DNA-directed RNA polymerase subunit RPC12/RpoP
MTVKSELTDSPRSFIHVHVCVHCGNAFRREAMEGRVHTTGLFVCLRCGKEGPLNVEIHEVADGESLMLKTE